MHGKESGLTPISSVSTYDTYPTPLQFTFTVPQNLLNKEKEDRLSLLHTMGTLHLMELFVNKVEKVFEQERSTIKLCPKAGKGITKRILVNRINDAIKWMSKIMVRRHFLPNMRNYNVLNMSRFLLWGPSIFPKEASKKPTF